MADYVLLVKLGEKNIKVSFPKKPKTVEVAAEVHKQAKLGPELQVVLSAPDPDFPTGGDVVLGPDAELKNKQVLSATAELKEVHSWEEVDCPDAGKAILKENGITPAVGSCLVHMLGYTEPSDLQHVTDALLQKLPLKPLEKTRLQKLIESAKAGLSSPKGARPPSARMASKISGDKTRPAATTQSKAKVAEKAAPSPIRTKAGDKTADKTGGKDKKPSQAATDTPPAAPATPTCADEPEEVVPPAKQAPTRPPADEDEDEMLARILAEEGTEKQQPAVQDKESQSKFATPLQKEMLAVLEGHKDTVLSLAMTPDHSTLYTRSLDNTIKVWNLKAFLLTASMEAHNASVATLAVDSEGKHLISGAADGQVIVWDVATDGTLTQSWSDTDAHAYGILAMTLANNKPLLFTATGDKKIRGFEIDYKAKSLTLAMEMSGHLESVRSMVLAADDSVLYSASEDTTIKVWHADSNTGYKFSRPLKGHEAAVYGLAISKDGSTLISCSGDKTVVVWKLPPSGKGAGSYLQSQEPKMRQVLTGHKGEVNCVAIDESGSKLYSSGDDKTIRVWGLLKSSGSKAKEPAFALQQTLEGHAMFVYPVVASLDGKLVVSGSADNTARVWSLTSQ